MGSDLYLSTAGAVALLRDLDIVANNLANADTVGFKRDSAVFEAAMEAALQGPSGEPVEGDSGLAFVDTQEVATDMGSGPVAPTGSPLDAAIRGPGFFEVETPEGPRFTRAGSFAVDAQGLLVTPDGHPVSGGGGPISVGSRPVEIQASGDLVDTDGEVVGRLQVVDFEDASALEKIGANLFRAPDGAVPTPRADAELVPGSLERSNVVPVKELTTLILLQRAYELNLQALQTDDATTQSLLREFQ